MDETNVIEDCKSGCLQNCKYCDEYCEVRHLVLMKFSFLCFRGFRMLQFGHGNAPGSTSSPR